MNELNKYKLLNVSLSYESINKITFDFRGDSIFAFMDAFFARDVNKCLNIYEKLLKNNFEPFVLVTRLISELLLVLSLKHHFDKQYKNFNQELTRISENTKIKIFRLIKNNSLTKNFSFENLEKIIEELLEFKLKLL